MRFPGPVYRSVVVAGENVTGSGSGSGGSAGEAADAAAHTFGPLDGSIYATVVRAGGGPSSPLSASMDSGISSAGRRAAPSPPDELDALLGDMLRTVSALPDAPQSRAGRQPDIPYHARADSAPFTYGTAGLSPGMLRAPHRLASPELVRRALGRPGYRPIDDDDEPPPPSPRPQHATLKKFTHEDVTTTTSPQTITNGRLVHIFQYFLFLYPVSYYLYLYKKSREIKLVSKRLKGENLITRT